MSARALLVEVETMMVGAVGREQYEELLHPLPVMPQDRAAQFAAFGADVTYA